MTVPEILDLNDFIEGAETIEEGVVSRDINGLFLKLEAPPKENKHISRWKFGNSQTRILTLKKEIQKIV